MSSRGKARSALAPIKDLVQSLELNKEEGNRLTTLTMEFLKETKKLQVKDIIAMNDKGLYNLARDLLETETTPGKGPTGSQYWPIDDSFQRTLTYAANPSKIIKLVSYIMRNQRKNLVRARNRYYRHHPPGYGNHEHSIQATADAVLQMAFEPAMNEEEDLREELRESPDLPTMAELLSAPPEVLAALYPSESTDLPSHLASPPITPVVSGGVQRHRHFLNDGPHLSVETPNTTVEGAQNFPPQRSLPSTTELRDRRRERSPTALAEYDPRLPTHRDGTLDEGSIKSWKDGVQFVKDRMDKFNRGLRKQHREHPTATLEDRNAALEIYHKSVGLDEFLEFLDSDLQNQQKRLREFKASQAPRGAREDRGPSCTISP